jgi:diaminopimelate epimerase
MIIKFDKYQATGNDFVMIDNRYGKFPKLDQPLIARLCHRKFGIGADGLILIEDSVQADFSMVYFNADGALGSFCGNGSRAATQFAASLGMVSEKGSLEAFDGIHQAEIGQNVIKMSMSDVQNGSKLLNGTFIDTGSPHYVEFRESLDAVDVYTEGKKLREDEQFAPGGSNINFVELLGADQIKVRTFERGVENETLSCGTGVTAAALTTARLNGDHSVQVTTLGGLLKIEFSKSDEGFHHVFLTGPAENVFSGEFEI